MKTSLYIVILVTFLDFLGVGLVYPLFSAMLFDHSYHFLPDIVSNETRGVWLGILFALMPFAQFFSSPMWGTLSDNKGRKKPLWQSLIVTVIGHGASLLGVWWSSLSLLLLSRLLLGIGCGNFSIAQAAIADLSSAEEKSKNFGLYAGAIGAGFALGPFVGGFFSLFGLSIPFVFSFVLTALNLLLAIFFFRETHPLPKAIPLNWLVGLSNLKKAFHLKNIRTIYLCSFLGSFGWTYFLDFVPVYLIQRFSFSPADVGVFYGSIGGIYALSAGWLIRPFLSRFKSEMLFLAANGLGALCIFTLPFFPSSLWLWPFVVIYSYVFAFFGPTSQTLVSNGVSSDIQGEALGILGSINTAAMAISATLGGAFIGAHAVWSVWIGGSFFLAAAIILLSVFRRRLFNHAA